jgi:hypothetical protein
MIQAYEASGKAKANKISRLPCPKKSMRGFPPVITPLSLVTARNLPQPWGYIRGQQKLHK